MAGGTVRLDHFDPRGDGRYNGLGAIRLSPGPFFCTVGQVEPHQP
jgi:hypothetical protein